MTVSQAIKERRSIRKYKSTPVEPEKLKEIAEAFRLAPSATNSQSWKLIIVTDSDKKEQIARQAAPNNGDPTPFILEAPVLLIGTCDTPRVMENNHKVSTTDLSIAMSFVMLKAQELGLGTCWMGYYKEEGVRAALGLSEDIGVVAIMPLGYADEAPEARPRKNMEEVVEYI
jgi:nitroreductase